MYNESTSMIQKTPEPNQNIGIHEGGDNEGRRSWKRFERWNLFDDRTKRPTVVGMDHIEDRLVQNVGL
jgi:hypothetical protein